MRDLSAHHSRLTGIRIANRFQKISAIKRLMGDSVRSKCDVAAQNEILGKLLAYNITCLVHAIYELKLEPEFVEQTEHRAVLKFPGVG